MDFISAQTLSHNPFRNTNLQSYFIHIREDLESVIEVEAKEQSKHEGLAKRDQRETMDRK